MTTATKGPASDSLAKIEADAQALDALLSDLDGDVSDDAAAEVSAWFQELDERRAEKVDGYGWRIKALKADAEKYKLLAAEIGAKAKAAANRADWLLRRMEEHLVSTGEEEIKGAIYTFKFQANGGAAPLVLDTEDPDAYPPDCRKVTVVLDKARVRERIEAGDVVFEAGWDADGLPTDVRELPAHLGERGRSLRLR